MSMEDTWPLTGLQWLGGTFFVLLTPQTRPKQPPLARISTDEVDRNAFPGSLEYLLLISDEVKKKKRELKWTMHDFLKFSNSL